MDKNSVSFAFIASKILAMKANESVHEGIHPAGDQRKEVLELRRRSDQSKTCFSK